MNYSMMTYSAAWQYKPEPVDMAAILDLTVELGLDAVDQVTLYGYEPQDLRRMADDRRVRFICYTQKLDFAHPEAAERRAALDEFREVLDRARLLGAPRVMVPIPGREGLDRDEARAYAIECLAEAVALGKEAGVTVTTESFVTQRAPFIISDDFEQALQAVPGLRITFDNGNVLSGGEDPVHAFTRHHRWIDFVHFKDYTVVSTDARLGLDGRHYRAALIGEGVVDYAAMVKAVKKHGYDGYINLECESRKEPAGQALHRIVSYLRDLEDKLE